MNRDAMLLVDALRNPATTRNLDAQGWTELLSMARAEQLLGTLAERFKIESVPPKVAEILAEARVNADYLRRSALWEPTANSLTMLSETLRRRPSMPSSGNSSSATRYASSRCG